MKKITCLFLLFSGFFLTSCETVVYLELEQGEPKLAVEALVTNQENLNYVKLAMSTAYGKNQTPPPVTDAQVSLTDNTGKIVNFVHQENGLYQPAAGFKGEVGRAYNLRIEANGQTYTAAAQLPEVPKIDTVKYQYIDGKTDPFSRKDGYYLSLAFHDRPDQANFYKIDLIVNGKLQEQKANDILVTDDKLFNGAYVADDLFKPLQQGDNVTLNLLSLNKDAYDYFRAIAALPGQAGLFGRNPANLPTNISNGAVGFFSASAVSGKTLLIR